MILKENHAVEICGKLIASAKIDFEGERKKHSGTCFTCSPMTGNEKECL